jgi:hypothetical protein
MDGRRGLLFAAVARPGALKPGRPVDRPGGVADLHVYDLTPVRAGRVEAGSKLTTVAIVPLGADVLQLLPSRDGLRLFGLTREATPSGAVKLVRVDTAANRLDLQLGLPSGTEAACMTPDGASLFAAVSTQGHADNRTDPEEGEILEIDPETLKVRRTVKIPHDPADIQASDRGLVFVSGGSNQHTALAAVDMRETRSIVGRWQGVYMGSRIRLSADQRRLFIAPTGMPPHIESWLLPANPSNDPTKEESLYDSSEIPLGGETFLSPAGDFLLTRPGGVVPIRVGGGGAS